jgi:predicted nucleotidyltransferase
MINYPVTEFLRHNARWTEEYAKAVTLELPDGSVVEIPDPSPPDTHVLKIRCMMAKEGVDPADEPHVSKVFHLSRAFWIHHQDVLFDSGLIRLNDGDVAVLREELLRTLHQFFHHDPVPLAAQISIHDVIAAASQMNEEG